MNKLEWTDHDGSDVEVDIAYGQFIVVRMAGGLEELYGGRFLCKLKDAEAYCIANIADILPPYKKKRWRAKDGDGYYYVATDGIVEHDNEILHSLDIRRYNSGNYFRTEEEAMASKIYQAYERNDE
jgi:hypothetical protein